MILHYEFDDVPIDYEVDRDEVIPKLKKWIIENLTKEDLLDYILDKDLTEIDLLTDYEEIIHDIFKKEANSFYYENKEDFTEAVQAVSRGLNISPALVEKDYYVTLVLKRLNEELSGLIFKGGTSLSKCHKAINRFSEDIDLTLDSEHLTEGQRKIVKPTIVKICEELGLTINNLENTRSRRDYNCYQISYPLLFENDEIDPVIKAETVFIQECYPEEVKQADSLIGEWLKANGFTKQAEEYGLLSFDIHVQTMERTLVDKVFALCDYMLLDDMQKHSRHIYDIYQLLGRVELNEEFRALIHRVREDRKYHSLCVSAQNNADIPALLEQVIETECYKKDYEEHTRTMLYTPCNYEEAITGLKKIIDSGMFGKDEEYEKNTVHISVSSASKIASYKEYRIFAMPEHDKYGDYAYKIPNKFISINRSEKAIVFHLPKDYVVRLKNGRTNQTAELTVTEFVAEVAGKDESAYGMKIIRPSQTANGGNTPKKKKTDFNSK